MRSLIFILVFLMSASVFAQEAIDLRSVVLSRGIEEHTACYADSSNSLTINALLRQSDLFNNYTVASVVGVDTTCTYWAKASFLPQDTSQNYVFILHHTWENIDVYMVVNDTLLETKRFHINERIVDYAFAPSAYMEFRLPAYKPVDMYFKLKLSSRRIKKISLKVAHLEPYKIDVYSFRTLYVSGIIVIIAMFLYNLLIYAMLRQAEYLNYLIMLMGLIGSFGLMIFYNGFPINRYYLITEQTFYTIACFGFVRFTQTFLNTKLNLPLSHRILQYSLPVVVIALVVHETLFTVLYRYPYTSQTIWMLIMLTQVILVLIVSVQTAHKRIRSAIYFFVGIVFLLMGAAFAILVIDNHISWASHTQAKLVFLFSAVTQLILFSLAIGHKFTTIQQEQIDVITEDLYAQEQISGRLETVINERTTEISDKNKALELRNKEIEETRDELERQNKKITDSIYYAKRIQDAMLSGENVLAKHFPEHFIFFKPKDIVSGDFYWMQSNGNRITIAVADCTGHGVPGAFMSMLGMSFLSEIVGRRHQMKANIVLNELRQQIKDALQQTGKGLEQKDGMDISLVMIDLDTMVLQYAGAYNPLYILRNGQIIQYKGDRMPIGIYIKERESFTNHEVQLLSGDTLYLFTDGLIDQFGGPEGLKYKISRFRDLLSNIGAQPLAKQKQILVREYHDWKGEVLDQVDDILVVGVRI